MSKYPKPALTVDAVVLSGSGEAIEILVIRRGRAPFRDWLAFPGGFVDAFELPFSAALRELKEETRLDLPPTRAIPLSLRAKKDRDPRGWTISQPFLFWLPESRYVRGCDDAREAQWVPLRELPRLAFDHGAILCEALGCFWQPMPTAVAPLRTVGAFGVPEYFPHHPVFYGGTFDPWHLGHHACVSLCPNPQDVVVVPDANPFKKGPSDRCYWSLFRELQSAVADLGACVFPGFCGREQPNPTAQWVPYVTRESRSLLVGEDSFASFPDWFEAETLAASLDTLFVAPRHSKPKSLKRATTWLNAHGCQVARLANHPYQELSSTKLRENQ